jgi:uncharacterized membrane protein (UPF0127 family)
MRWFVLTAALLATVFAGCRKEAPPPEAAAQPLQPVAPALPTQAQPPLRTIRLWMGPEEVITELALTQDEERAGLMFRTNLAENAGMLFVFPRPIEAEFWMKNCTLPLSAGYIDPEGNLAEIHPLQPDDTNSVMSATNNIQYVLEVNQGWFDRHHIPVGTYIRTEVGSLPETFFRRR